MRSLPVPGAVIAERYRIERLIGEGGMGAVFAAVSIATGRAVAIKWLLPDAARSEETLQRFQVEAQAMARIEHPNVVSVLDVGRDGAAPFLVMERLRGESLQARLTRSGRLPVVEALDVIIAAAAGVAEAHAEGIVHRDLKPANIFLCEGKDGSPRPAKVLDFGVSKLASDGVVGPSLTKTGVAVGTPSYMAPEQLSGDISADPRCDVYALGVVLYQMLAGRRPFRADGLLQLVAEINAGQPTPLRVIDPSIPEDLAALTLRAMSARAVLRPPSVGSFLAELVSIRERYGRSPASDLRVRPPAFPLDARADALVPLPIPREAPRVDRSRGPSTRPAPAWGGSAPSSPVAGTVAMDRDRGERLVMDDARAAAPRPRVSWWLVALTAVLGGLLIAGSVALLLLAVERRVPGRARSAGDLEAPPSDAPEAEEDPLRPLVELTFDGCAPELGASPGVTLHEGALTVSGHRQSNHRGAVMIDPGQERMVGSIQLSTRHMEDTGMQLFVMEGQKYYFNYNSWMEDHVTGTLSVRAWDAARGVADLSFDDATLQSQDGSLCRVNGRLRTFGLTWGEPSP